MQKQFIKSMLFMLAVVLTFQLTSFSVFAQSSSAISPWMGMFDRSRNPTGLDNYNRLVKPRQEMLRSYANHANQIQAQQRALRSMQNSNLAPLSNGGGQSRELLNSSGAGIKDGRGQSMLLSAPREIPSSRSPAGFNQYLHYYPAGGLMRHPVPNFSSAGR